MLRDSSDRLIPESQKPHCLGNPNISQFVHYRCTAFCPIKMAQGVFAHMNGIGDIIKRDLA